MKNQSMNSEAKLTTLTYAVKMTKLATVCENEHEKTEGQCFFK